MPGRSLVDYLHEARTAQQLKFQWRFGVCGDVPMLQRCLPYRACLSRVQSLSCQQELSNFSTRARSGPHVPLHRSSLDRDRPVRNLAVSSRGDIVCSVHHPTTVSVFNVDTNEEVSDDTSLLEFKIHPHRPSSRTSSLKFVECQAWIAVSYHNAPFVDAFDLEAVDEHNPVPSRRVELRLAHPGTSEVSVCASSLLPVSERMTLAACSDGHVRLLDFRRQSAAIVISGVRTLAQPVFGAQSAQATSLTALSSMHAPVGFHIATGDDRGVVNLYDLRNCSVPFTCWEPVIELERQQITHLHCFETSPHELVVSRGSVVSVYREPLVPRSHSQIHVGTTETRFNPHAIVAEDVQCVFTPCSDSCDEDESNSKLAVTHLCNQAASLDSKPTFSHHRDFQTAASILTTQRSNRYSTKRHREDSDMTNPLQRSLVEVAGLSSSITACARLGHFNSELRLIVGSNNGELCIV